MSMWVLNQKIGVVENPLKWMVKIRVPNPMNKWDDLGGTIICGNTHVGKYTINRSYGLQPCVCCGGFFSCRRCLITNL